MQLCASFRPHYMLNGSPSTVVLSSTKTFLCYQCEIQHVKKKTCVLTVLYLLSYLEFAVSSLRCNCVMEPISHSDGFALQTVAPSLRPGVTPQPV